MFTQEKAIRILNDPATAQINFRYQGVSIYGSGYRTLAEVVANQHITFRLEQNQQRARAIYLFQAAIYNYDHNTITIPHQSFPGEGVLDKSLIVHEMTHALCDWQRVRIRKDYDEVLAYTAQTMYLFRKGIDTMDKLVRLLPTDVDIKFLHVFTSAWNIASTIATTSGGYLVPEEEGRNLAEAITALPLYSNAASEFSEYDGF